MTFVRTVRGDVPPASLGFCYAHEHLVIDPSWPTHEDATFLLDDVDLAVEELAPLRALGVGALVDSMPAGCGRNVRKLAEISRRTGLHVVCPTGVHLRKYYPPWHWIDRADEEDLARLFVADIDRGVDVHDASGPVVRRGPAKAGVIKVATSGAPPTALERRVLAAAGAAHRATGCPILTHTERGRGAHEQCDRLEAEGVAPGHIVLSHVDRAPDAGYHRSLLDRGVTLEYDSGFRWPDGPNPTVDLLAALVPDYPGRLVAGMDAARRAYWRVHGGAPGMAFLATTFVDRLRAAGLTDALVRTIFVDGPARVYAFRPR